MASFSTQEEQIIRFRQNELRFVLDFMGCAGADKERAKPEACASNKMVLFVCGACGVGKTSCMKLVEKAANTATAKKKGKNNKNNSKCVASNETNSEEGEKGVVTPDLLQTSAASSFRCVYVDCALKSGEKMLEPVRDALRSHCAASRRGAYGNAADRISTYSVLQRDDDDELLTDLATTKAKAAQPALTPVKRLLEEIRTMSVQMKRPLCVVLDEVDRFRSNSNTSVSTSTNTNGGPLDVLGALVSIAASSSSSSSAQDGGISNLLKLVLVSNDRGLVAGMPRSQLAELTFNPYTIEQMTEIAMNECSKINNNSAKQQQASAAVATAATGGRGAEALGTCNNNIDGSSFVMRKEAAEYVAKRVASTYGGDARKIVAIAANTLEHHQLKKQQQQQQQKRERQEGDEKVGEEKGKQHQQQGTPTPNNNSSSSALGIAQVVESFSDAPQSFAPTIQKLTRQQLLILSCCVKLATSPAPATPTPTSARPMGGKDRKKPFAPAPVQVATTRLVSNANNNNGGGSGIKTFAATRSISVREVYTLYGNIRGGLQTTTATTATTASSSISFEQTQLAIQNLADEGLVTQPTSSSASVAFGGERFALIGRPNEFAAALLALDGGGSGGGGIVKIAAQVAHVGR